MSIYVTAYVRRHSKAKLGARLVLYALADRANDDGGGAWPAVETIATEENLSRRAVQDALRKLEHELKEIRTVGVHPRYKTTIYEVLMTGADSAPYLDRGAQKTARGGADSAPKPSYNHPSSSATAEPTSRKSKDEDRIFEHWRVTMKKSAGSKFTDDRRRKVRARLRDGFTVEQLEKAVTGCSLSDFHMGKNDGRRKYNDLELICRSGRHVEQFIEIAEAPTVRDRHRLGQTQLDDAAIFDRGKRSPE